MAIVVERQPEGIAGARILVVDDEPTLRDTVRYNLIREGYVVDLAETGPGGVAAARALRPDLIVLDIMLPGLDGLQVCRILRAESTVPILLLSAKGDEIDRVVGLEIGADDYLAKPFAMRELVARIRAMLRRSRMSTATGDVAPTPVEGPDAGALTAGDITVDAARRSAVLRGRALSLKPKEFDLLHYLARHPGIVLSREALLREVWGYDFPVDTRTVDVHISGLRQKLGDDPGQPRRIQTVRGFGYRFVPVLD